MVLRNRGPGLCVCLLIIILLEFCPPVVMDWVIPEKDIIDVYNKYREAAGDVMQSRRSASRRVLKNNTEYQIHVKKLKGVNGFKAHNLIIRSGQPNVNKTMYINNPVESKMPQAFLSLDEFKQALINRVHRRETLKRAKLKSDIIKMWKVKRKGRQLTPTRTIKGIRLSTTVDSNKKAKHSTKKHRSQLISNLLTEDVNVNETIPLQPNENFKVQSKITSALLQVEVSKQSSAIAKNTSSILVLVDEKPFLRSDKNYTNEHVTEIAEITAETSKPYGEITGANEVKLIVESTVTDVKNTATLEDIKTDEPTTEAIAETEALTTKSTRATLGRPAVYMGY